MARGGLWWMALAVLAWGARAGPGPPAPVTPLAPPHTEWRFPQPLYNLTIAENSAPRTPARAPPGAPLAWLPLPPGARVRFRVRHGDKERLFKAEERAGGERVYLVLRARAGHVLNRERRDRYELQLRASATLSDGMRLETDTLLALEVSDVNDLSPLFYPTEYDAEVPEDAPPHTSVARVSAEDADVGLNGEIYYSLQDATDQFAVHVTSGVVSTTRALRRTERHEHILTILAQDRASLLSRGADAPAARARLTVRVRAVNLHAPELRARVMPAVPPEDGAPEVYAIVEATDRDEGAHGEIASVEIVDGDPDGHFRVRASSVRGEWDVVLHPLLGAARASAGYNLTLRAADAGTPPRAAYLSLAVPPPPPRVPEPVFSRALYEVRVSETAPPRTPLVRLKVAERRDARVYIEIVGGNEGGEFWVEPDSGVLYTAAPLDAERRALHALTVAAVGAGTATAPRDQASAKVQVTVVDANDNDPVFEAEEMEVEVAENAPAGGVVARVQARDADSGENGYVSYSIANLQAVPFDVEHFSGTVRATRLLDYESMRRTWHLLVRASDWGLPYRRQAELRLTVKLRDVNDNRPQFERLDCVGYVSRRAAPGRALHTLSAIDFDAGDVVSYRIAGGNDDGCFALDAATGVLSVACDLAQVRVDTRVLNVTATDGTHFADPATLTMHLTAAGAGDAPPQLECRDAGVARRLTELLAAAERANAPPDPADEFPPAPSRYGDNLHSPEFVEFPVEVQVNESVRLGTRLLQLKARDRDRGYNGLLVYAISGGDGDSAFRVDPDTGELQVIGYLDREREAEYFLNITVRDLGSPPRAASRLLPVTVLDVNDNTPRFDRPLASFRVTENALNGTAVFHAHATDADVGRFAQITYSVRGADGEFCIDESGVLRVCAPLDRERRALYELTLLATDGGGRAGEACVRVAVDDVNDNAPRFELAGYSARVREDVPPGTLVALLGASDPDGGAGGQLRYSLPEQDEDAVFTIDELSGALRTVHALDYEERQVHGVTVRATDGGAPALWSEATVIVEVLDVDENAHAPQFADELLEGEVREDAPAGTVVMTAAAKDADPPGRDSRLQYYILDGTGMGRFSIDDAGVIRTLVPLDRETTASYWLTVCAEDGGAAVRAACVPARVAVADVNDEAPWPHAPLTRVSLPEHAPAGTPVAQVTAVDNDLHSDITYRIVAGNPDGLFTIEEKTGVVVTTGRALDREVSPAHALEVRASDGALGASARLSVTLLDVNDHAPVFTQRFYQLRAPVLEDSNEVSSSGLGADESSTEWEVDSDDEDEGSGARGWEHCDEQPPHAVYVGAVLALDSDAGANGTVRYASRARVARGSLCVHARSGRLYLATPLRVGQLTDLTVRACDGASPARCGAARVALRGAAAGGGSAPLPPATVALQAAELDAPGFLLHLLQASDPENDVLYYDIVDGDPTGSFYVGREDGSLVLARRLRWETAPRHTLNISVTDGVNTVYTTVNITVVNDVNEDGLTFSRDEYTVDVGEDARVGEALLALRASPAGAERDARDGTAAGDDGGGTRVLYGLLEARAPASLPLFHLNELTGVLELRQPLDRETAALHSLTVWARDSALRPSRAYARVTVRVHDVDEHAPAWPRRLAEARVPLTATPGTLVATLRAADLDGDPVWYSLAGGDAGGAFSVHPALGELTVARALLAGKRDYTLQLRAQGPPPQLRRATLPLHVTVVEPDHHPPQFLDSNIVCEVFENEPAGTVVATPVARSGSTVQYALRGGQGVLAVSPLAGAISTLAPLDYETQQIYNLTVIATNMGGGSAEAQVTLHVLDRNEHAPRLAQRRYRGRVSEAAGAGTLVVRQDSPEPLALLALDEDSPAHQQRTYELAPPDAADAFTVHAATGALALARRLDYETQKRWEFTVKVLDMGEPRLPSDSVATVVVDVEDVNDCAPVFEQQEYEATLLLPTVIGALVLRLQASDEDTPAADIKYDVLEGDAAGDLRLDARGALLVARADALRPEYRLRVRASDGALSGTTRVIVHVRAPEPAGLAFQKADYYGSVVENSTKATTVAVLSVLGAALDEHVEFSILNPVEGFTVGRTSGAVVCAAALDREAQATHTLLLAARGAAGRAAQARLHVAVLDVNDNCPLFTHRPYRAAVRAGAPAGTELVRVHAIDADDNDNGEVRYEMKRGHGELFRVERRSGAVTLKQPLDARQERYELVIAAFDGGTPACGTETEVSVRVWGGGAAPSWPRAHYQLSAREDVAPGALLATLRADSPLQRQLIYTLLEPKRRDDLELHFDTARDRGNSPCSLVAVAPLDAERERELQFTVRATDGVTGAHADVDVTLGVVDVNDCAPAFERDVYRTDVSEAAPPGHLLLTVQATDNDTGLNGEVVYSLTGDWNESQPLFTVDPSSGAVVVAAPLDRERHATHHALLVATDRGAPALNTSAHLFIGVLDVNDCAPRMERAVVSAAVAADAARGTPVAAVRAWDPDAPDAARLRYALASHEPHHTFAVHPRTGVVTLANTRAWAAAAVRAAPLALNVSVSDGAHAAYARIKLTPVPVNAHAPRFQHLLHEARALENQPGGLLLTTVQARDEDWGELGAVTYSIPSARLRETFAMDARSGALSTRVPLDREARAEWLVPVLASDGGGRVAHTAVRVRVADLNDHAPVFPHAEYAACADLTQSSPFLTLQALDADEGEHARLRYTLYEREDLTPDARPTHDPLVPDARPAQEPPVPDARGLFRIDPDSGALSLAKNATEFESLTLRVWVRATDGGGRAGEAVVSVRVLAAARPRPAPAAPPPVLFLPEDAPPGTLIAALPLPDPATNGVHRYRLAGGLWARDQFALDGSRLLLAAALDRELVPKHRLAILAEGPGTSPPTVMLHVTLHVLDVNDHAPAFHSQPYVLHLAEDTPPQTSILQVMADDLDVGSNGEVHYSFGDEPEAAESVALFALEPQTGWLVLVAPLDRERAPEHRLPLRATDQAAAPRSARGSVIVRLRDVNDNPPAFSQSAWRLQVREDAAPGELLLRLRAADPDLPAPHALAYFISDGDPDARFTLRVSGELLLARALDRETQPRHELTVTVSDGRYAASAAVHVEVLDADDNPPYCARHRYYASLPEDASVGTAVLTVEASDADEPENARLRFYLTGDGAENFAIDEIVGRVTVAAPLDRETLPRYRLSAHAQARGRPAWECTSELRLELTDVNDNAPRFSSPQYSVTLPEDAEPGALVCKVHAVDADLGANRLITYSLLDDSGAFRLAGDSGIVTLAAPLDRETAPAHRARVLAVDGGQPPRSAHADILLTVADVNDNPPEFELQVYHATVPELDAVGTEVARVHAISKDAGVNADVYYSIVGGDGRDDFTVHRASGVVSISRPLDYERARSYALTLQALDGGVPPLSDHALLNVTIVDCNDNAPVFTHSAYSARVREDAPPGAAVLNVRALDADTGDNGRLTYSIVRGDPTGVFDVDARSGDVTLAAPLDRETVSAYILELRATDGGEPALAAVATLQVEVLDANDNPPLFERANYSLLLQEDRPPGHALLQLLVTDADAPPNGPPFTFDFQAGNEARAFRLEQDGVLRTAARFNHRVRDAYSLQLRVFDNGAPPLYSDAWVNVRVVEQSQYPPVVTPLEVQVCSYLDEFPGGTLGRVRALDRDAYDTLSYELTPPSALFELDARTGELRAAPRLDPGDYALNATVNDGRFSASAPVRVRVLVVTDAMLAHAAVVRFREVSDVDFVLSHRKGFVRAVAEAAECSPRDVVLLSVQASGEEEGARQVAGDLDVLFCVRAASGGWATGEALRRRLHTHLEALEERARLVVEELVRAPCGGCVRGACLERAELLAPPRVVASEVFALVAPRHRLLAACACEPGWAGARCDTPAPPAPVPAAAPVLALAGDGYALYRLHKGVVNGERVLEDVLSLSLRFRTRAPAGVLAYAAGRVDYLVLEIVDGFVQVRMELGGGEASARAGMRVSDGAWHVARLERRGGSARLQVDRHSALAAAPPPHAVLDTGDDHLYIGAALLRHQHANAPLQVSYGFSGCLSELRLGGVALPLDEGGAEDAGGAGSAGGAGGAVLLRTVRLRNAPRCPPLPPAGPCAAHPCLNGGTCEEILSSMDSTSTDGTSMEATLLEATSTNASSFRCACHSRFSGAVCERDSAPCQARPCLHGGQCAPADQPPGYTCACAPPARGQRCQHGYYCDRPGVCGNGGSCEEGAWGPSCRCRGYYGPTCQHDVDECAGEPCADGATCLNEPGSFRCVCPPHRTGTHCGNPLHSDAVLAAGGGPGAALPLWRWVVAHPGAVAAAAAAALVLLAALALLPLACRRARRAAPPPAAAHKPAKLSNLAAARDQAPPACACAPPLNNADTLRSYGSAGDELEAPLPPAYLRNLNLDPNDRKPWSEQMHLRSFTDNKIYNDLKGTKSSRPTSPAGAAAGLLARARRPAALAPPALLAPAGGGVGGDLVGGYHWDCSDWCGGALPAISELTANERRDSSSPPSAHSAHSGLLPPPPLYDTSSGLDDDDTRYDFADAGSYLLHPDAYLPREGQTAEGQDRDERGGDDDAEGEGEGEGTLRALRLREPDAASLITLLEERAGLLPRAGSAGDVSARLCEIEDSDDEPPSPASARAPAAGCRHTDV